ncbi:MAG TPA: hypothetical protein VFD91_09290 [Mariniphaga sp.]|nr:hypothetical protein [Mariniphaga sp.]
MIVYQKTKDNFRKDVLTNEIDTIIHKAYYEHLGRYTSPNETLAWKNSMMYMDKLLEDQEIPCDAGVSIEYGSRNNKIVLVQHNDHYDSENEGSYSIKKYTSQKNYDRDTGEWLHERIVLKPLNTNYDPIIIHKDDGFMVVGEFLGVVEK